MSDKNPNFKEKIESRDLDINELKLISIKDKVFLVNLPQIKCNEFDVLEKTQINIISIQDEITNIDIILGFRWKNKKEIRYYLKSLYKSEKPKPIREWQTQDGNWVGVNGEVQ